MGRSANILFFGTRLYLAPAWMAHHGDGKDSGLWESNGRGRASHFASNSHVLMYVYVKL